MRNGEQTNGALALKKRRSKRTLSNGSVKQGGHKREMFGSTVTATLTNGTLAQVNGWGSLWAFHEHGQGAGLVANGLEALTTASEDSTQEATKRWKERR